MIFKGQRHSNPLTKRYFNLHYKVVTGLVVPIPPTASSGQISLLKF